MASYDVGYEDMSKFKVKNAIIAEQGWSILAADQGQVELRVSAIVSNDPDLVYTFRNGIDMHSNTAKACFAISVDLTEVVSKLEEMGLIKDTDKYNLELLKAELQIIKETHDSERTASKSISFGVLYGMSKWGLSFDLNAKTRAQGKVWSEDECQVMIDRFNNNFKVLNRWLKGMQAFASKNGYTYTLFGRRRWLPEINSRVWKERSGAMRKAINTPIQSLAADIMMLGLINMRKRLDPTRSRIVATVHDSVVCEIRDDYIDEAILIIKDCMENPLFRGKPLPFLNIPLVADFEVGQKYGSMKKIKNVVGIPA